MQLISVQSGEWHKCSSLPEEMNGEVTAKAQICINEKVELTWARESLGAKGCNEEKNEKGCRDLHVL